MYLSNKISIYMQLMVLGFAGMILAFFAVIMPVYLFWKVKIDKLHYPELENKFDFA